MKIHLFAAFFLGILCWGISFPVFSVAQGVAINAQGQLPDTSAELDVSSSAKGLLIPRLTTQQRDQVNQPAKALLIFNLTSNQFEVNTGTKDAPVWMAIVTLDPAQANKGLIQWGGNNLATGQGLLGTKNAVPLSIITNNALRIYIDSLQGRIGINTAFPNSSLQIKGTDAISLPSGTTAERPVAPVPGMIRFNKETGKLEGFTATGWVPLQ